MESINIMPYQYEPFNGDTFVCDKFLKLSQKHNCTIAYETGTALGGTTKFLSKNFKKVYTVEINADYQKNAINHVGQTDVVEFLLGDSIAVTDKKLNELSRESESIIYFLDSHWGNYCPLIDELKYIGKYRKGNGDVIVIHDFLVPGSNLLGHDSYNNQPFEFKWIEPYLSDIYPKGYGYEYNSDENSEGARRGVIYIYPKNTKRINIFTEYYQNKSEERQKEIDFCIIKNAENRHIDKVYLFTSSFDKIPTHIKDHHNVTLLFLPNRMVYNDFFDYTHYFPDDINVLCNTDIYFDETILNTLKMSKNDCSALLRHELTKDGKIEIEQKRSDSQDAWVFLGAVNIRQGDFNLGIAGCDNKIAHIIEDDGKYNITNPCSQIKAIHYHLSNVRNYIDNLGNVIQRVDPPYKLIKPC